MSSELFGIIGVVLLIALICARVWVGAALAIVGFFGIVLMNGLKPAFGILVTAPFSNLDSYVTTAIPMFTLMGMIIAETSIGRNLFEFANKYLGRYKGGVASATVVASGLMGAITGSDNVSCVIMSKLALPELKRLKYADSLACASVAAGAPLAILIPPSMAFIMYAMLTEQSVGTLFMAGIVPGVIMVLAFVIAITVACRINDGVLLDLLGHDLALLHHFLQTDGAHDLTHITLQHLGDQEDELALVHAQQGLGGLLQKLGIRGDLDVGDTVHGDVDELVGGDSLAGLDVDLHHIQGELIQTVKEGDPQTGAADEDLLLLALTRDDVGAVRGGLDVGRQEDDDGQNNGDHADDDGGPGCHREEGGCGNEHIHFLLEIIYTVRHTILPVLWYYYITRSHDCQ